jgi:DNA polymerase lambda
VTSGLRSYLVELSGKKDTHVNVDPAPISSRSSTDPEWPARGPSNATGISEFVPQATSTQLPAMPAAVATIQTKVSNLSRSKPPSKRDRVIKIAPKHMVDVETSNVTTPDATRLLSIPSAPNVSKSSSVLHRGDSKTKLAVGKDKKPVTSKSKKKEKELMTPLAYAQILCNKLDVLAKKTDFLKGKRLFYTGGDMQYASQSTKKKMELVMLSHPFYIRISTFHHIRIKRRFHFWTLCMLTIPLLNRLSTMAEFLFLTTTQHLSHML